MDSIGPNKWVKLSHAVSGGRYHCKKGKAKFKRVKAPAHSDIERLVHAISHRIASYLEKAGSIQRDMDNSYLDLPIDDEDTLLPIQAASVSYRIAVDKDTGKKVFTLQTLPAEDEQHYGQLAQIAGFSLHAGVFADSHQTDKLERRCRYISRLRYELSDRLATG